MSRRALVAAVVVAAAVVLTVVGLAVNPERTLAAYLVAVVYWLSLALGTLLLTMIGHAARTRWIVAVRRVAERVFASVPALAVLFVPVVLGVSRLYPWAGEQEEALPEHLGAYLTEGGFAARALVYFVVWIVLAELLFGWSRRQDAGGGARYQHRQLVASSVGIPLVFFALTFASFDWVMSLEPRWISTAFGVYLFTGGFLGAVCLVTLLTYLSQRPAGALSGHVTSKHFYALGRLMLAFTVFWAYIAYSQFFLIWIADLPEEVGWYAVRLAGPWKYTSWLLAICHFLLPFLVLLQRPLKHRPAAMAVMSVWLLFWHYVDVYWLVMPARFQQGAAFHWADLATLVAVGGLAASLAIWRGRRLHAVPVGDPELARSLRYSPS